jgi:hypothetical protein|tara:strand:- start:447 stop:692 length:246 start_codon:yes stop_codon:yes gene_type:complete
MSLKVDALRAKYIAMRLEAIATLEIYSKNAVGIGEHSQVIDEMDKLIRTIADTNGYLEALDAVFVTTDDGQEIGKTGPING